MYRCLPPLCLLCALVGTACTGRALPAGEAPDPGPGVTADTLPPRADLPPTDATPGPAGQSWVTVQPGSFMMGSPESEPCRLSNEVQHPVTLTHPYVISATEVTQATFHHVMGYDPSSFSGCGADCPADSVDWNAAVVFCNRLSEQAGLTKCYSCVSDGAVYAFPYDCSVSSEYNKKSKTIYDCPGYRLPTEAEWEYAYRAGTSAALFNGPLGSCFKDGKTGAIAWYGYNSGDTPHGVAQRQPNAWALYDMAGNLWEWTNDWYQPDLGGEATTDPVGAPSASGKVLRGGAWISGAGSARAASRNQSQRFMQRGFIGFRVVRRVGP